MGALPKTTNTDKTQNAPIAAIDAGTDARLRLAAGNLIDSFLAIDSMKDDEL